MHCNIHIFLERKRSTDKKWELDSHHEVYVENKGTDNEYAATVEIHSGRSYEFFGELAGVKYTHTQVQPKGIPKNASKGFLIACEQQEKIAHSHSYISIKKYATLADKCGFGKNVNITTSQPRNPFLYNHIIRHHPFHTVLAYIHDEKESNAVNYILTNDSYYLDEKFRLMFFFDN